MLTKTKLDALREEYRPLLALRPIGEGAESDGRTRKDILVCGGTGCSSSRSLEIIAKLEETLAARGIANEIRVVKTGCFGLCALGPIMIVYPEGSFYSKVTPEQVERIVDEHIIGGNVVKEYLYPETVSPDGTIKDLNHTNFYAKQERIALRSCGNIAAEDIREYIAADGYQAAAKALTTMTPKEVTQEVLESGLRGRGGAGFPTGRKWSLVAPGEVKYILCNADEGDPGAFMDRSVLEGDPHVIIEAMTIAGYAIGAHQGYVYVRAEYPIAVKRLAIAINQARELGLLGKDLFGSGFDFDLEIRLGSGAFVCGEETALMRSIEGKRGEPRPRPPFPAVKGLFDKPSILNNVETYANIPQIILKGAQWFRSRGTESSAGTKVFCLVGKIQHTGLVEVPMGTTLREIIYDIGGGIPNGKKFKAAQTGGPSGGCIPASLLDTPIDFDNLSKIGAMMGSGGMIVMDEDTCMVDIAKFYLTFTCDESCGKCTPCRIGTHRLLEILDLITKGKGTLEMLDEMEELCHVIQKNSLCALGQTAPNPVLSTLKHFREEYVAHIVERRCPAGVCKDLLNYAIDRDKCIGCGRCAKNCPVGTILKTDYIAPGHKLPSYVIDTSKCIKCGVCITN